MNGLHIEFLGIPGSGKTTISNAVATAMRGSGHDALLLSRSVEQLTRHDVDDPWVAALLSVTPRPLRRALSEPLFARSSYRFNALRDFATENPEMMAAVFKTVARRSDYELRPDLVIGWIFNLASRFQLATNQRKEGINIVIDEGFINRAVSLFGHGFASADRTELADYLRAVPRPDLVIHLNMNTERSLERLHAVGRRGTVRLDRTPGAHARFLADASACIESAVEIMRAQDMNLHTISASARPGQITRAAVSLISRAIDQRSETDDLQS